MKIDKKHFPPISVLGKNGAILLDIPENMYSFIKDIKGTTEIMNSLVVEGRKNVITSTKEADNYMAKHKYKCLEAYLKDPNKKDFGGAYIDMQMPVPSMDLFKFVPAKYKDEDTGVEEEAIFCFFISVQDKNNTVVSFGSILFRYITKDSSVFIPAFVCADEEEKGNTVNYMIFLLELNCFLEYGNESDKNVQKVYGNQRKSLPDGYVIDNRSGHIIRCLCTPKK